MGDMSADLVALTFVMVVVTNMSMDNKSADLADLAFGEIGRKSAPQEKPEGTLTAQIFFLYL
ncbi:MAG: hypothetical protein Q4Q20_05535 [Methanocorpusculum sp.]|nr:hypothetical protein [Methanocorpusculum sp.]